MVSDQYAPDFVASRNEQYSDRGWLDALLALSPRDQLIAALTAATRVATPGSGDYQRWTDHVLTNVDPVLAALMRRVLESEDGGPQTLMIARQALLLAMRTALVEPEPTTTGTSDPRVVATLLAHHVSRRKDSAGAALGSEPRIAGYPESLAMSMVANALFNVPLNYGDLIARTWLMWTSYEQDIERFPPRLPLREMVKEATGIELHELLAIAFGLFAHAETTGVDTHGPVDISTLGVSPPAVAVFLELFSDDAAGFRTSLGAEEGEWFFLPFEARPLLRTGQSSVLVLDEVLLQRRFTSALYWLVHDHERDAYGDKARVRWTQTYSELVEIHAENLIRPLAPTVFGGGSAFFTEDQVKLLGGAAADCGIDFGDFVLIADIVQHQFTVPTRAYANAKTFDRDVAKAVVAKAKQLSNTIDQLLTQPEHPAHPLGRRPARVVPMVVEGADFPGVPLVYEHVRDLIREEGYLSQPECTKPQVVTMTELEMLTALLAAGRVPSVDVVIRGYVGDPTEGSLTNYLYREFGGDAGTRTPLMRQALEEALADVELRLNLPPGTVPPAP